MSVMTLFCVVRLAAGNNLGERRTKYSHNLTTPDTVQKLCQQIPLEQRACFQVNYTDLYFRYLNEFTVHVSTVYLCVSIHVFVAGKCKAILELFLCLDISRGAW